MQSFRILFLLSLPTHTSLTSLPPFALHPPDSPLPGGLIAPLRVLRTEHGTRYTLWRVFLRQNSSLEVFMRIARTEVEASGHTA